VGSELEPGGDAVKIRYLLLILASLAFTCPAKAQTESNCSDIQQIAPTTSTTTSKASCSGRYTTWLYPSHYDETWTFNFRCITIAPLAQTEFARGSVPLTEIGSCYLKLAGGIQDCPPTFTVSKIRSATAPSMMTLFWQAYTGKTYPVSGCYKQGEKGAHATANLT
jgi:hypothetical protein